MGQVLTSNHISWQLSFEAIESTIQNESLTVKTVAIIVSLVTYPIFFVGGIIGVTFGSIALLKSKMKKRNLIRIFNDDQMLQPYFERKKNNLDKRIDELKQDIIRIFDEEVEPSIIMVGLQIPQKRVGLMGRLDHLESRRKERWRDFNWETFAQHDFFMQGEGFSENTKAPFHKLEKKRVKLRALNALKENFTIDTARKIAEMSYVKNAIKEKECRGVIAFFAIMFLIPTGLVWGERSPGASVRDLNSTSTDLSAVSQIEIFRDCNSLIEAHNKLLDTYSETPLVPYRGGVLR
ncbi:MAG: hypothetical protein Tsb0021_14890 [Chlamydiales bacterium]